MICCLNSACDNPSCPDVVKFCPSCGIPLVVLKNRYRPTKSLGGGGFGKTYLAEDVDKLNEQCVIKQFAPQFQGTSALVKATELFEQEARRLQQLGEHHQIPTLLAYFQEDNGLYLVQQFINGQNLLAELQQEGAFKEVKIRQLLLDLLNILKSVHQCQVVHRDIKPENIIRRDYDGKVVLIDFGAAKQLTATAISQPGTAIGSFGYAPLEQMQGGQAYPTSDLYSLGVSCFHLLSGIHPWELWQRQGYGWVTSWRQYLKQPISQKLGLILDKLLKEDYQERYQSADEVLKDLNAPSTASSVLASQLLIPTSSSLPKSKVASKVPLQRHLSPTNLGLVKQNGKLRKNLLLIGVSLILVFGGYKYWQSLSRETAVQSNSHPTLSLKYPSSETTVQPNSQSNQGIQSVPSETVVQSKNQPTPSLESPHPETTVESNSKPIYTPESPHPETTVESNSQPIYTPESPHPETTVESNSQPIYTPESPHPETTVESNSRPIYTPESPHPNITGQSNHQPNSLLNSHQSQDDLSSEKGVNYTKLQSLLAAANWSEADKETKEVMLQAVDTKEGNSVSYNKLSSFACTDLRTVDHLWKKYSDGRFGFSVQKEIYLSAGGKPGSKYDVEAWKNFGDHTGWRVKGQWIKYGSLKNINFSTSAPPGHLPYEAHLTLGARRFNDLGFFSRIYSCNL